MRFVPGQRRLELAAGEFAHFGEPASSHAAGGRWRAELGREWHETLRRQARENDTGWEFEVGVKTFWIQDGWTLAVEGRIDQLRHASGVVDVREVKTVAEPLPQPEAHWRETRRPFFVQLALYCRGLAQVSEQTGVVVRGTLLLVNPATGVIQEVPLGNDPDVWLAPAARQLAHFAESRWTSRLRLSHLRLLSPFMETRPEWLDAQARLAMTQAPAVLLEAPTGFGKTALALDYALRRLRDGEVARIVYATGKNSGRIQVERELMRLVEPGALRVLTLHAKEEHTVPGISDDPEIWQANWRRHGIDPDQIFDTDAAHLETVRALGAAAGVPPWEITRALLPLAELILCDYNYLFSPRQAGVLANLPGWDTGEALLIVDEAHNLPTRAAEARSFDTDWHEAKTTLDTLHAAGAPKAWLRHWEAWTDFLGELPAAEQLDAASIYLLRDLCEEIARLWEEQPPFWLELEETTLASLFLPAQMAPVANDTGDEHWSWSPQAKRLRIECLCAAEAIGEVVHGFHQAILMSATLAPEVSFIAACGLLPEKTAWLACDAGWRNTAYSVAVDLRVDTRLKSRERHFRTTAETVLALGATTPVAVFFPSYRYAEAVKTFIAALDPGFRVAVQPAGATPAENAAFVEEALLLAHGIFLVMGGGLAEGIDLLGGRVDRAMVVSPGLPEMNPVQAARMALLERRGDTDAFRSVYLIPALRKVNQALGRLVRGPGHRAQVLLHCRRFAEANYASLLAPEYRGGALIRNERDLLTWLG